MASMLEELPVYLHTNRPTQPAPRKSGFGVHTGWWSDKHAIAWRKTKGAHGPWGAGGVAFLYKYDWLLEAASAAAPDSEALASDAPLLLLDTDSILQCGAAELRRRWERFDTPLVYSAERECYPSCKKLAMATFPHAASGLRFPCTGAIMGTRAGFELVRRLLHSAMPRFPCCHELHAAGNASSSTCLVEEQGCVQRLIQADVLKLGRDVSLDTNASLFLNTHGLPANGLVDGGPDGSLTFGAGGHAPCVLHTNSNEGKALYPRLAQRSPPGAWIVTRLERGSGATTPPRRLEQHRPQRRRTTGKY